MTINEVRLDQLKHELMDIGWEYIHIEEIKGSGHVYLSQQEPAMEVEDFFDSRLWTEFQNKHK